MTGGTYFTGGGMVEIAMRACGIAPVFGVEYDDAISNVARANGLHVLTTDVRAVDPAAMPYVDWFHASPVCKNASTAKRNGEESVEDIETADAVCRYIKCHKPRIVSIENVYGYRKFQAFQNICATLEKCGYTFEYWHLNSANYGVPQTRRRLALIGRCDGVKPRKPHQTHFEKPSALLGEKRWIGWYAAIENLLPTLPPSKFAKWQLDRLPKELTNLLVDSAAFKNYGLNMAAQDEPCKTIVSNYARRDLKAFVIAGSDSWTPPIEDDAPIFTIGVAKALHPVRTFIMNGIGDIIEQSKPMMTVPIAHSANGYVVKMTPRALARFQSIPDDYDLPENKKLAGTVIGNAVPPLLMQAIIHAQIRIVSV